MPDLNAWKVTLLIQEGRFDANETYYGDGSLDATTVQANAVTLANARQAMMPAGVSLFRIRISAAFAPYQTFQVPPPLFAGAPGWKPGPGENQDGNPDQAKAALQVDKYSGVRHQRGRFFLFGVPDVTLGGASDPRPVISPASWAAAFNAWVAIVQATWKNRMRTDTTAGGLRLQVTAVDNAGANGLLRIVIPTPDMTWGVGARVQLRRFTQDRGAVPRINAIYQIVARLDATPAGGSSTLTLRGTDIPDTTTVIGLGTAELVAYVLQQITKAIPVEQTTRKRGNRGLVGPGRRLIRR